MFKNFNTTVLLYCYKTWRNLESVERESLLLLCAIAQNDWIDFVQIYLKLDFKIRIDEPAFLYLKSGTLLFTNLNFYRNLYC